MERVNMIVAHDRNLAIGYRGDMPWMGGLPADLKHFKEVTSNHTVIMGRTTHDAIGRPLPNRRNIVLSRQTDLEIDGCEVVHSMEEALAASKDDEVFIIGGAKIYHLAMPNADRLYITEIEADFEGDTFFPPLSGEWQEVHRESHEADETNLYNYTFIEYERNE